MGLIDKVKKHFQKENSEISERSAAPVIKEGIKDYDGNIIVSPVYLEIYGKTQPFLTVRAGNADSYEGFASADGEMSVTCVQKSEYKEGLITPDGKTVIPARYERIGWCRDHKHFFCCSDGCCEMYAVENMPQ